MGQALDEARGQAQRHTSDSWLVSYGDLEMDGRSSTVGESWSLGLG